MYSEAGVQVVSLVAVPVAEVVAAPVKKARLDASRFLVISELDSNDANISPKKILSLLSSVAEVAEVRMKIKNNKRSPVKSQAKL